MDPKYGDILYLRGFLGMKNVEIAKMLNISTELVNVRYQRARELILNTKGEAINEIRGK
jgi:DNA-directed RNA polymerase specialized sigma24 family protein